MEIFNNTETVISDTLTRLSYGMSKAMYTLEADVKEVCPVKTGNLKRSYTSDVEVNVKQNKVTGSVGSNVDYAVWADMKTPHLTLMAKEDKAKIESIIENELKNGG